MRARPGSVSAPGRGQPSRWIGHTNVTSTATCAPWKDGRPLATTSRRRASVMGSPRFNSRRKTSVATRPPASRQIWATTLSTGTARRTRTPAVAQAARWSPRMSSSPPQRHSRAVGGRGKRKRRSRVTRKTSSPMWYSGRVGKVVSTVLPPGPAWDNRSARDAEVISEKSVSRASRSTGAVAARCHLRAKSPKIHVAQGLCLAQGKGNFCWQPMAHPSEEMAKPADFGAQGKGPRHTGNICCWDWPFFRRSFSAHCFCTGGSPDVLLVGKLYRAGRRMVGTAGCRREELAKGRKISVSIVRGMKNGQVKHSCMGRENRPAKPQSRSGGCSGGWTAGSGCGLGNHADQAPPTLYFDGEDHQTTSPVA